MRSRKQKGESNVQTAQHDEIISAWTYDDYASGKEPYEWLYTFVNDGFTLSQLRGKLMKAAAAKGMRNFGETWRQFLRSKSGLKEADAYSRVTAFSGQPMELLCGEYDCQDDGVKYLNAYNAFTTVCSHPIMPSKRLVNIESGEVKMEIAYKRGRWRKEIFDKGTLASARNIVALAQTGVSVTSESAKELVKFLSFIEDENYLNIPEVKTIGRLGWVDGYGFSPYVDGLMYDAGGLYGDAFSAVRQHGSFDKWLEAIRKMRASNSTPAKIMLAASFASPLVYPTNALPFMVHVWGSTAGIGKSVALIMAASVWAYPEIGSYVKTTKSTSVGYEQMAAFCGHLPLCMDELQLIQGRKEFDDIIYSLCEGVSKTRGSKSGGVQQVQRWRNAILTTGEMPITTANSKAGAVNRVIEVECTAPLFEDAREAYQIFVQNYGHAGKRFVEQLAANESAMETLVEMQQGFYEDLKGKATDKQVLAASLLLAADAMADLLILKDGNSLPAADILPYLTTQREADTNRRAYDWLCDWIASNPARFAVDNSSDCDGECWGFADRTRSQVYIIKGVFDRVMTDAGFNPASFLSWADKSGLIDCKKGHKTKLKRIGKGASPARCVCLAVPDEEAEAVFEQMEM